MTKPGGRNRIADGLLLLTLVVAVHCLAYQAARGLFLKSQRYSADARVLVIGNSRVEQGIMRQRINRGLPGGAAFLASQGMDLKLAGRLLEAHLAQSKETKTVWLSVDPWQVSEQYGEQGFRNWLPFLDRPAMDAYFKEALKDERKDYWFMKTIPLLRFNGVKARLFRTAMGLGNLSVNKNVVTDGQIQSVLSGYAGHPLLMDEEKLQDLSAICSVAEAHGAELRLFFMPVIPELARPWDIPGFKARVEGVLRGHSGVSFVDFNDKLRSHEYFRDTGHLNSRGAEAFSGIFLDSLRLP